MFAYTVSAIRFHLVTFLVAVELKQLTVSLLIHRTVQMFRHFLMLRGKYREKRDERGTWIVCSSAFCHRLYQDSPVDKVDFRSLNIQLQEVAKRPQSEWKYRAPCLKKSARWITGGLLYATEQLCIILWRTMVRRFMSPQHDTPSGCGRRIWPPST